LRIDGSIDALVSRAKISDFISVFIMAGLSYWAASQIIDSIRLLISRWFTQYSLDLPKNVTRKSPCTEEQIRVLKMIGCSIFIQVASLAQNKSAQHSVQLTVGRPRVFGAFVWLWAFPVSTANPPSYPPQLTLTVGLPRAKYERFQKLSDIILSQHFLERNLTIEWRKALWGVLVGSTQRGLAG